MTDSGSTVVDVPESTRFEIHVDGRLAGYAEYVMAGRRIVFSHTEIDGAFEGRGLGGELVRGALDAVDERSLEVVPVCPFVAAWIQRHPDYARLVTPALRPQFEG